MIALDDLDRSPHFDNSPPPTPRLSTAFLAAEADMDDGMGIFTPLGLPPPIFPNLCGSDAKAAPQLFPSDGGSDAGNRGGSSTLAPPLTAPSPTLPMFPVSKIGTGLPDSRDVLRRRVRLRSTGFKL